MATINVYTSRPDDAPATEPASIPTGKSALPGTGFLYTRPKFAKKELGFAGKCKLLTPGSKWTTADGSSENTVIVDYVTAPGTDRHGKPRMVSANEATPSEPCYVSYTDTYGTPHGYTPLGKFLFLYPMCASRFILEQSASIPEPVTFARKVTALDLGAIV